MSYRTDELRESVVYSIVLSKGWLSPTEKLFALRSSGAWDSARSRDQADLLMAAGCFEEAIPRYAAFSHWRKVGDALFAMGRLQDAKAYFERGPNAPGEEYQAFRNGPDRDRLISIAAAQKEWQLTLDQIRLGQPEPFLTRDVIFCGSTRAKAPLIKLFAHAAAKAGENAVNNEMEVFFGLAPDEAVIILEEGRAEAYAKDIAKLARPPLTRTRARTLEEALFEGQTDRAQSVATFLSDLDNGLTLAVTELAAWKSSRAQELLDRIIFWLTHTDSYQVLKSCLFALQCEHPTYGKSEDWEIDFYTAHPWLIRSGMRELLRALVADETWPSPNVLLCCAFQHSASPFDLQNIDLQYADPLVQIRSQPVWAEAVIATWQRSREFSEMWSAVRDDSGRNRFQDTRLSPAFAALAKSMSTALQVAWKNDFDEIRWKAEHSAFLGLKTLLPSVEITQHASPVWLAPQHFDIFMPDLKVAIEYQGEQHFGPIAIFGGEAGYEATVKRDATKRRLCDLAGVQLEYIRYDEALDSRLREIAESVLRKQE